MENETQEQTGPAAMTEEQCMAELNDMMKEGILPQPDRISAQSRALLYAMVGGSLGHERNVGDTKPEWCVAHLAHQIGHLLACFFELNPDGTMPAPLAQLIVDSIHGGVSCLEDRESVMMASVAVMRSAYRNRDVIRQMREQSDQMMKLMNLPNPDAEHKAH